MSTLLDVVKHLPGKHNQASHGRGKGGGGGSSGGGSGSTSPSGNPIVIKVTKPGAYAVKMNVDVEYEHNGGYKKGVVKGYPFDIDVSEDINGKLSVGRLSHPRLSELSKFSGLRIGKATMPQISDVNSKLGL